MNDPSEETDFQILGLPEHLGDTEFRARADVEVLASQFVEEFRAGERPSVENYARRYPEHANTIRDSFPVLALLEQTRVQTESNSIRRNMPERFPFSSLGRCELLCELGRGGMGVVFQGREAGTGHLVAVKVLPWRVSIVPELRRRFEEEARTTARMRHRNIVPVFRFGQEHGYCYYVMQFVNGIGLDEIIKRLREVDGVVYQDEIERMESAKPNGFVSSMALPAIQTESQVNDATERRKKLTAQSWKSFTQIAIQSTQALRYAHSHKILHNDIKPANVLLDNGGRVWITDFGLSASMEPNAKKTAGRLMGTLRYMAPERLVGMHDARSDLYSLGITLYELVTQQVAFDAANEEEMIRMILEQEPPNPRKLVPDIPKGLETIILNCIAKHPPDRYSSAEPLLVDLVKFSRDERVRSVRRSSLQSLISRLSGDRPPTLRDYFGQ